MNGPLELAGTALRVRFVRIADRYAHVIEASDGGNWQPVLESVEGAPDDIWPPSPPLQDVHIEQRPGGLQVALLVGRAGRSHWSLSISLDGASQTIEIDAACRASDPPRWLGSTYRLRGLGLAIETLEGIDQASVDDTGGTIALPVRAAERGAQTIRWRYRIGSGKQI